MSDDEKRSIYDKYGEAGLKGAGMGTGVCVHTLFLYQKFDQQDHWIVLIISILFLAGILKSVRSL